MKPKHKSYFISEEERDQFFSYWVNNLEQMNNTWYKRVDVNTMLGTTVVWSINDMADDAESIVIFPGFRTSALFWDLDNALSALKDKYRIYLVETNGQPNLSDGSTPEIRSADYGLWALEVIDALGLENVTIAGASFGGLVCLKLGIVAPERINKTILLNPGCLQPFSLSWRNLYYNMLPILFPSRKNVEQFLENAVLNGKGHDLTPQARKLLIDYEVFALKRFKDNTQKPYAMDSEELAMVQSDVYLVLGDKDILFPHQKSKEVAERDIRNWRDTWILAEIGHGIETTRQGIEAIATIMNMSDQKAYYPSTVL
ncbi:MAG: alpha/beta hydrolase [Cyclobacteriaceae bacterium]